MKPELGRRFCSPYEIKSLLSKYDVANGYDLYFYKNDKDKLLVKYSEKETNEELIVAEDIKLKSYAPVLRFGEEDGGGLSV
ncbi:hypothetical protein LXL04_008378 [Taraxacum kok-saghyz]